MPRFAIGTIQQDADSRTILLALLATLRRGGIQVQCFSSRASLPGLCTSKAVTGLPGRFLDSWLMSPEVCRALFTRSTAGADLAAIIGHFDCSPAERTPGGSLNRLGDWLGLPRLAVVDVEQVDKRGLPERPTADGVLLDHRSNQRSLPGTTTDIETLWGIPVVGTLGDLDTARRKVDRLQPGDPIPTSLLEQLSDAFLLHWRPERFAEVVRSATELTAWPTTEIHDPPTEKPTVAVAYDEAFFGYFPSTLDQLELLGARVVDFSPLRDESLPPETDIVYLGCGRPEDHAHALSENHCMKAALRSHMAGGGRIYGAAGGAAYLSQTMQTPSGEMVRMSGLLPSIATCRRDESAPQPVEITVARDNWLASAGTHLRGYRNGRWRFQPLGCQSAPDGQTCCQPELIGCNRVVGTSLHLHLAALPEVLANFFRPVRDLAPVLDPWRTLPL